MPISMPRQKITVGQRKKVELHFYIGLIKENQFKGLFNIFLGLWDYLIYFQVFGTYRFNLGYVSRDYGSRVYLIYFRVMVLYKLFSRFKGLYSLFFRFKGLFNIFPGLWDYLIYFQVCGTYLT